ARREGLASDVVTAVVPDGEQGAWAATAHQGVQHIAGGRIERSPALRPVDAQSVYAMLRDSRGRLWMGTHDQGLYWLDGDSLHHLGKGGAGGLPDERVYAIEEDHGGGGVWVGTRAGVVLVRGGGVVESALGGSHVLTL